ncbi:MAG: polymer-forming cytoskeletal protein [Petrimonas sp.]|nr:polymer-forming cytoskeletal protein [Petrimonas sp.]
MIKEEKKRENGVSRLDSMPINTIIGNDIVFKGDIYGESVIRIDGRVEGNISLKQGIILGDKAFVEGNMESDYIILFGHIRGNVKSKEIVLKSTGTVQGDIVTDALEIEMGSRYNGNLKISRIEEVEGGDYEPKPVEIVPLDKNVGE